MKRVLCCATTAMVLTFAPACAHRDGDPSAEIRTALAASSDAFNRGDLDGHLAIYLPEATMMTKTGPRPGRDAIKAAFTKTYFGMDGKPFQHLAFDKLVVRPLGTDHALSTGSWGLTGGGRPDLGGWFTLIWEHEREGWRVIHDHSS